VIVLPHLDVDFGVAATTRAQSPVKVSDVDRHARPARSPDVGNQIMQAIDVVGIEGSGAHGVRVARTLPGARHVYFPYIFYDRQLDQAEE
jgi:hypothetical protein